MPATSTVSAALRVLVFQGSTRVQGPPRPARVGNRVAAWAVSALSEQGHTVEVFDPIETDLPLLRKPHFAYAQGQAPQALEELAPLASLPLLSELRLLETPLCAFGMVSRPFVWWAERLRMRCPLGRALGQ